MHVQYELLLHYFIYFKMGLQEFNLLSNIINYLFQDSKDLELLLTYINSLLIIGNDMFVDFYFEYICKKLYISCDLEILYLKKKLSNLQDIGIQNFVEQYLGFVQKKQFYYVNKGVLSFISTYAIFYIISIFISYLAVFGYCVWANVRTGQFVFKVNYNYLTEVEGEYGAVHDYIPYIFSLLILISWYYIFNIFLHFFTAQYLNTFLICWYILILITLSIPFFTLKGFGLALASYVRGSGKTSIILIEVLLDLIAISVIFIRFFIQNIRFVLIFIAFFELYEYTYKTYHTTVVGEWVYDLGFWEYLHVQHTYTLNFTINLLLAVLLYFYYTLHLTILYLVQLAIYTLLSFWLFCFLFTSFVLLPEDKYLVYQRIFKKTN